MNLKAGIITQARMTSTRLPGKILMEANHKQLLKYHIERLGASNFPVYIATTVNKTDDVIAKFAEQENIVLHRGSEDNVLERYYHCAKKNSLDIVVRVTSDCPLIDGKLIGKAVEEYKQMNDPFIYLSNCVKRTYPRGFDFEIFSFALLEEAFNKANTSIELEHVTPYINQNKSGKVKFKHITNSTDNSDIRITVDTGEDFLLVKTIIEQYGAGEKDCQGIIDIFNAHPELKDINRHIEQKKQ
jgi:spore coat polysaccharide biosynthesis protein SpsF